MILCFLNAAVHFCLPWSSSVSDTSQHLPNDCGIEKVYMFYFTSKSKLKIFKVENVDQIEVYLLFIKVDDYFQI